LSAPEIATFTTTSWQVYVGFFAFVLAMLFVDLKLFHADEKEPSLKESGTWVAVWVALGLGFGLLVLLWRGVISGQEYFAGYLIEYSLSVDNMFVFVVIFQYFRVPKEYQHRVLFFGILGAIVFRTIFIVVGVALIRSFEWVIYIFGAFLLFTAYRIAKGIGEAHPEDNPILKFVQRRLRATSSYQGRRFFVVESSKRVATPLFVVLVFIEVTDFLFALDSIPAVIAVSRDPFVILTSNVFAVLGLRALYFLLAGAMSRFHLLHYGLSFILAFVGSKMLLEAIDFEVPILVSLAIIVVVLVITAVLSLSISPKAPPESASEAPEPLS
jgi:tellurite resistance protein TerC